MNILTLSLITALATGSTLFGAGPAPSPAPAPAPAAAEVSAKEDANPVVVVPTASGSLDLSEAKDRIHHLRYKIGMNQITAAELCKHLPSIPPQLYGGLLEAVVQYQGAEYLNTFLQTVQQTITPDGLKAGLKQIYRSSISFASRERAVLEMFFKHLDAHHPHVKHDVVSSGYRDINSLDLFEGRLTPLHWLIGMSLRRPLGHLWAAEQLISHGANINTLYSRSIDRLHYSQTVLHEVVRYLSPHWVSFCMENGSDPNIRETILESPDTIGLTPLELVAELPIGWSHREGDQRRDAVMRIFEEAFQYQAAAEQVLIEILMAQGVNAGNARALAAIFKAYVTPAFKQPAHALAAPTIK